MAASSPSVRTTKTADCRATRAARAATASKPAIVKYGKGPARVLFLCAPGMARCAQAHHTVPDRVRKQSALLHQIAEEVQRQHARHDGEQGIARAPGDGAGEDAGEQARVVQAE